MGGGGNITSIPDGLHFLPRDIRIEGAGWKYLRWYHIFISLSMLELERCELESSCTVELCVDFELLGGGFLIFWNRFGAEK